MFGGFDFSNYFFPLSDTVTATSLEEAKKQGAVFAYGNFLTVVINFLILAWIIFLMVKGVNNMRKRLESQKEAGSRCPAARRRATAHRNPRPAREEVIKPLDQEPGRAGGRVTVSGSAKTG